MKDLILLPTYNERNNVQIIIDKIFSLLPDIYILVVDDNSPDKTAEVVFDLMKQYPHLSILQRQKKTGLGDAYKEAMQRAVADKNIRAVITMDADGSHSPEYLRDFLANIDQYDLIIGSRYVKGGGVENWEFWRRKLSSFGNMYARILSRLEIRDITAGFTCVRREVIEKIDLKNISSSGYAYLMEFKFMCVHLAKARVKEVPIIFKSRMGGESKISNQIIREGLIVPWKLMFKFFGKK